MNIDVETTSILRVLDTLPPEKVSEVRDFVEFLQARHRESEEINESDEWSDEDIKDFGASSRFAELSAK